MHIISFFPLINAFLALKSLPGAEGHVNNPWAIKCLELRSEAYEQQGRHKDAYNDCEKIMAIAPVCVSRCHFACDCLHGRRKSFANECSYYRQRQRN